MSDDALEFRVRTAIAKQIRAHLAECSSRHRPPLAPRVDLDDYAQKIFDNAYTFEAWSGGKLVGLVAAYLNDRKERIGYVTNVSVTAEFLGRGVASSLMDACLARATTMGMRELRLEVGKANTTAIELYRNMGFVETGDNGDFIAMTLSLGRN